MGWCRERIIVSCEHCNVITHNNNIVLSLFVFFVNWHSTEFLQLLSLYIYKGR